MSDNDSMPADPPLLTEASALDILQELIRRRRFNQFDGPRIAASLRRHGELWQAVLFRSDGLAPKDGEDFGIMGLFNLRDVADNRWNADRMYILCGDAALAHRMAEVASSDQWEADEMAVHEPSDQLRSALCDYGGTAVVELWWD